MGINDVFDFSGESDVTTSNMKPNTSNEASKTKFQVKRKYSYKSSLKETEPSKFVKGGPSAASQMIYRKWQQAADEMGSGQKIVVDKMRAKQLIFDWLHDQFKPKTITDIYKVMENFIFTFLVKANSLNPCIYYHFYHSIDIGTESYGSVSYPKMLP
jgi:hypothetical protein